MDKKAKTIAACCGGILLVGAGVLTYTLNKNRNKVPEPVSVAEETEPPTEEPTIPLYDYVPSEEGMTERAKMLLKKNKDVVGWIRIPNTDVDYPFVRDPGEIPAGKDYYGGEAHVPNEYYLDHALDGSFNRDGTLFMDYRDRFGADEDDQSENIIIYGHNMANNTMFGSLRRYRQDFDFYAQAPFIQLSSNYRDYDYVICGFLITSGNWYCDFVYWDMEELDTEKEFNNYMDIVHARQMYDTGVDVKYGDKLLTLSTCYADEDNSRFIVVARRLRDGEVAGDLNSIQRTEEYKKALVATQPTTNGAAPAAQN